MKINEIEENIPTVTEARKMYAQFSEKTKWNNIVKAISSFQHAVENTGGVEGKGEEYIVELAWLSWAEFHAIEKQLKELLRKKGWYILSRNVKNPSIRVCPLENSNYGY